MWNVEHVGEALPASAWLQCERRESLRLSPQYRDAWLYMRGLGEVAVSDLSPEGVGLLVNAHDARALSEGPVELSLGAQESVRATAHPVSVQLLAGGEQARVGLRLSALNPEATARLCGFLLEEHREQHERFERYVSARDAVTSRDAEHIARLLRLHEQQEASPLVAFEGDQRIEARLELLQVDQTSLQVRLREGAPLRQGRRYGVVAPGRAAVCAFRVGLRAVTGDLLTFALPREVVQSGFRTSSRVELDGSHPLRVTFEQPHLLGRSEKLATGVSGSGLSMPFDAARDMLVPGDQLHDLQLEVPGASLTAHGIVRSVQPGGPFGTPGTCGVELLEFGSHDDQVRWREFVFSALHPRLVRDKAEARRQSWQVLRSSGYVGLWTDREHEPRLEREYEQFWQQAQAEGNEGSVLTLSEGGKPVATVASNALWPRTWMSHQLGVDSGVRTDKTAFLSYTRELYSGLLYGLQREDSLDYLALYMEADTGWNDFMYGGFARMYGRPDRLLWSRTQVYRCQTEAPPPVSAMDRAVRVASAEDRALMAAAYARTCQPLEVSAMELHAEGLSSEGFDRLFCGRPHARTRASYVFAPEGQALWSLVCETGNEGANVFGLFNRCWLTQLAPCDSRAASAARHVLLRRAVRHFAEAGKHACLLFEAPETSSADPLRAGFTRVSDGAVWISHRDVLPAWLAYVDDALSIRRARARRAA